MKILKFNSLFSKSTTVKCILLVIILATISCSGGDKTVSESGDTVKSGILKKIGFKNASSSSISKDGWLNKTLSLYSSKTPFLVAYKFSEKMTAESFQDLRGSLTSSFEKGYSNMDKSPFSRKSKSASKKDLNPRGKTNSKNLFKAFEKVVIASYDAVLNPQSKTPFKGSAVGAITGNFNNVFSLDDILSRFSISLIYDNSSKLNGVVQSISQQFKNQSIPNSPLVFTKDSTGENKKMSELYESAITVPFLRDGVLFTGKKLEDKNGNTSLKVPNLDVIIANRSNVLALTLTKAALPKALNNQPLDSSISLVGSEIVQAAVEESLISKDHSAVAILDIHSLIPNRATQASGGKVTLESIPQYMTALQGISCQNKNCFNQSFAKLAIPENLMSQAVSAVNVAKKTTDKLSSLSEKSLISGFLKTEVLANFYSKFSDQIEDPKKKQQVNSFINTYGKIGPLNFGILPTTGGLIPNIYISAENAPKGAADNVVAISQMASKKSAFPVKWNQKELEVNGKKFVSNWYALPMNLSVINIAEFNNGLLFASSETMLKELAKLESSNSLPKSTEKTAQNSKLVKRLKKLQQLRGSSDIGKFHFDGTAIANTISTVAAPLIMFSGGKNDNLSIDKFIEKLKESGITTTSISLSNSGLYLDSFSEK